MKQPDVDDRYRTAEGCLSLARDMDAQAENARILMERHLGWARALRSRAGKISEAETLEAEAKAARAQADAVANQQAREVDPIWDALFGQFATRISA